MAGYSAVKPVIVLSKESNLERSTLCSVILIASDDRLGHSIFYPHPPYGRHDSDRPFAPNSVSDTSVYSKIRIRHPEFVIVHRFQRTANCRTISSPELSQCCSKKAPVLGTGLSESPNLLFVDGQKQGEISHCKDKDQQQTLSA